MIRRPRSLPLRSALRAVPAPDAYQELTPEHLAVLEDEAIRLDALYTVARFFGFGLVCYTDGATVLARQDGPRHYAITVKYATRAPERLEGRCVLIESLPDGFEDATDYPTLAECLVDMGHKDVNRPVKLLGAMGREETCDPRGGFRCGMCSECRGEDL